MPPGRHDAAGLPHKRVAAGLLITDPDQRVLLVEPAYKVGWEVPGGCVEADESPYRAAIREVREELGLELTPGRLLVVDWVPATDGRSDGVMVIYDGGTLGTDTEIVVPPAELTGWAWSDTAQTAQRLPPLLARRITQARHARATGSTYYLENGVRLT
ncbi:NUDIX hydrolase [Micromonospora sp. WMMD1082]|uniref:NUDIX domain-containing protein n=1 Tax=Micromonospora sp. WMMD1082 TaxID=3016104 RepID=UPI0024178DD9|nr:NUDIX hydrolase [Micromonospora sp. WMMD1082]MDG4795477.1 NUDIX hydrolase [Micromonospora sp. WMMD1082]